MPSKTSAANESRVILEKFNLHQIFDLSYDSIFVTDDKGNVFMVNQAASRLLKWSREDLIGKNVQDLMAMGCYDHSTVLEAIEKRKMVTGLLRTGYGLEIMSTSVPILNDAGNVIMVITNSREKDLIDSFMKTLELERALTARYRNEVEYLRSRSMEGIQLVAESASMKRVLLNALTVAKVDSTVMIYGESGTGKEVVAKYIHVNSNRAGGPFITVNCAAIPGNLVETELFGYDRGAFSGANAKGKPGLFELADHGTLFLDEIAELPLNAQAKLLRFIENGETRRVGSTAVRKIETRLIGATNKDLKQMIADKTFREDLYYRLNVIPIFLKPLRERPEDIVALAETFLARFNQKYASQAVLNEVRIDQLLKYAWPGNARELRNVIERFVITGHEMHLPTMAKPCIVNNPHVQFNELRGLAAKETLKEVLSAVEQMYIAQTVEECHGRINEAAQKLGIHRTVLYRKMNKYRSNFTTSVSK